MKVRIKFSKYSPMIFIGHLDMMRYFQKAIRRAELDITYSTGFSPHQIMSFAAPLGVGMYSNGEYMDIGMDSVTDAEDIKERLQAQMVEGVDILSVTILPETAGNAMASVAAARYTVRFREGYEPDFELFDHLEEYYRQETLPAVKQTKKNTVEFDLKQAIYELSWDKEKQEIYMLVNASSSGNVKPGFIMEHIYHYLGQEPSEFAFVITREDTYTEDADGNLIPLDQITA